MLQRDGRSVVLLAEWRGDALDLGFVRFEFGDRFTEHFYADRWYNIFEIRSVQGRLKGWYCNIARPASIDENEVAARDLALDLWVAPDGAMTTLDEDEFAELSLTPAEREAARAALNELREMARRRTAPFDAPASAV